MALLQERVKKNEEKIVAVFKILDDAEKEKIENDKKEIARIAIEEYKNKLMNRFFRYLLIPIILLIIQAIVNWVLRIAGIL